MMRLLLLLALLSLRADAAFFNNWDRESYERRQSILTNSGALSAKAYTAGTRLMQNTKAFGVRKHICRVGVYTGGLAGGTDAQKTNAWVVPLIKKYPTGANLGHALDFMVAFTAADFDESVGATGNGSTMHLRTNLGPPDQGTVSSMHHAVYCRTNKTEAGACIGGSPGGAGVYVNYFLFGWVDSNSYIYYDADTSVASAADTTPFTGLYLATRTSTTNRTVYRRGAQLFTSTTDVGTTPAPGAIDQYVHALDVGGSVNSATTRTLSFYSFGDGLSAAEQLQYYKAVQRHEYDMGRAIP